MQNPLESLKPPHPKTQNPSKSPPPKMSAARSVLRSAASRVTAATRLAAAPKPMPRPACSPIRISKQNPLSSRIFRSPVELSCCVETMLPYHTATASALLTSMLFGSHRSFGWNPEGKDKTR
ncbi:protein NUCLEAR FUSION DEFECTIVE 6, chloroplastic/mitochondrial-like isoform X2 [Durio zibethinus]|uniref:Protein NUCLEAR FUSION DEFECTIVE 6, chloroplastic/mitochondrial-like isoform X2 n=1 Tax=Durio zibethinus TaxID=66656 RepID=A0A6P6BJQ4_DURZI|nr:protein NUCLEAR FUSION DEFECTIVE 6, chloroplastic/mitochondrial-like isoform X2 [Durio zibethinus]